MSFPSLVLLTLVLLTRPEAYAVAYKMDPGRGRGINPNKANFGHVEKSLKKKFLRNEHLHTPSRDVVDYSAEEASSCHLASESGQGSQGSTTPLHLYPALVLNADYQPLSFIPLSLWSWQESIKAVFAGRVTVVDTYDVQIRGVDLAPLPSVIALHEYIPLATTQRPAFTRRNVFLRDGYDCQYCGTRHRHADLTLDHVVPRSLGGPLSWTNAVTCCKACNTKKGCKSLSEISNMGMKLRKEPKAPTIRELNLKAGKLLPRYVHESWKPYLEHLWGR